MLATMLSPLNNKLAEWSFQMVKELAPTFSPQGGRRCVPGGFAATLPQYAF